MSRLWGTESRRWNRLAELTLSKYLGSVIIKRGWIKYGNLSGKLIWESVILDKYLGCRSNLEAYPWISDLTSDNNLGLNLYIVFTTCYIVIILGSQESSKDRVLRIISWKSRRLSQLSLLISQLRTTVMEHFGPNILFFFYIFFFWFYFYFYFSFRMMKKAHDKEVTWQVTWCDVISLELDERVWKMTLGYLEYTWWPWVGHKAGMRIKHGHKGRVIY